MLSSSTDASSLLECSTKFLQANKTPSDNDRKLHWIKGQHGRRALVCEHKAIPVTMNSKISTPHNCPHFVFLPSFLFTAPMNFYNWLGICWSACDGSFALIMSFKYSTRYCNIDLGIILAGFQRSLHECIICQPSSSDPFMVSRKYIQFDQILWALRIG